MIAVIIYRPELDPDSEGKLEGVELFGLYPDVSEDSVNDMVTMLSFEHPTWRFNIEPGVEVTSVEETRINLAGSTEG